MQCNAALDGVDNVDSGFRGIFVGVEIQRTQALTCAEIQSQLEEQPQFDAPLTGGSRSSWG